MIGKGRERGGEAGGADFYLIFKIDRLPLMHVKYEKKGAIK